VLLKNEIFGDVVSEIQEYLSPGVEVLKEDVNGLMAIAKPPGCMAHPNAHNTSCPKAITPYIYDFEKECYRLPNGSVLFVLNRLDAPTSGVMLVTLKEVVADAVRCVFRERRCHKTYQAWVKRGSVLPASGIWRDTLSEMRISSALRTRRDVDGVLAETHYEIMEAVQIDANSLWRLCLCPHTGRTHQLRVQCALRKCPILGDRSYGDFHWNRVLAKRIGRKDLFLHSACIALDYRLNGRDFHFSAEQAPDDFWDLARILS
jgi:23S rRNA-/tRNA-specific pseudouridylate synthase